MCYLLGEFAGEQLEIALVMVQWLQWDTDGTAAVIALVVKQ